jgi:uncharacterized repeat protein (TIGR03803 family)
VQLGTLRTILAFLTFNLLLSTAWAQTESVLYSFTGGADGSNPIAALVFGTDGTLYGTTFDGGDLNGCDGYSCGVVFKLTQSGLETVLYTFTGDTDGANPMAGVVLDASGNMYGTTYYGGGTQCFDDNEYGCGTLFKLTPFGTETILHRFTSSPDGANPGAAVILDAKGNMYGTTYYGGAHTKLGVVFKADPSGKETLLYSFAHGGADPAASLVLDAQGNMYGTTLGGGTSRKGTVFKLTPSRKETILHSFGAGKDGNTPYAGLVLDAKGNLYGTTGGGGASGHGTVFKVAPSGTETVLYSFSGGTDGANPVAGLILDAQGNMFGTTSRGGDMSGCNGSGCGVVFRLTPAGHQTVLYSFAGGTDGSDPEAAVIFDSKGNLYGTTFSGGEFGQGTVFKVTPALHDASLER